MNRERAVTAALAEIAADPTAGQDGDPARARSRAYAAAVALVQAAEVATGVEVSLRLRRAMDGRIVLEQAKGVLAQRGGLAMDEAFALLRRYAGDHDLPLTEVADAVVHRRLRPDLPLNPSGPAAGPPRPRPR